MGEKTDEIESQIREERAELRANLDELGDRVRSVTDWRRQFRNNPVLGVGLAFGGGLLLAAILRSPARDVPHHAPSGSASGRGPLSTAWETIQSALIGVAATKVTDVLTEFVPGFREHLAKGAHAHRSRRPGNGGDVQGEGNYEAARRYRAGVERYVHTEDVDRAARAAQPRSEAEAEELEAAEDEGRSRAKVPRQRDS